jgi:hypothetical protein
MILKSILKELSTIFIYDDDKIKKKIKTNLFDILEKNISIKIK